MSLQPRKGDTSFTSKNFCNLRGILSSSRLNNLLFEELDTVFYTHRGLPRRIHRVEVST